MNPTEVEEIMVSHGKNCKSTEEDLSLIALRELVDMIRDINSELVKETKFLRTVIKYSKERYRAMKTRLSFVSMSVFNPRRRKYEHFESAQGWIIDIDSEMALDQDLIRKMRSDQRVAISFISPNGNGLKLIFVFSQPYTNKERYSEAYKAFSHEFGLEYNVLNHIDFRNSDVSRICFICHDANCYYNENAIPIEPEQYEAELLITEPDMRPDKKVEIIPADTYRQILEKLGKRARLPRERPYVPEELLKKQELIRQLLAEQEIEVITIEEIQYGLKVEAKHGNDLGEILIYYGRKGFRLLTSPQKGYNPALSEAMRQILIYQL